MSIPVSARESKYCDSIRLSVQKIGHATNAMVLDEIRKTFPNVSATTVHRATARLAARGELMVAPSDIQGSMRYEVAKPEHDHFLCTLCGQLRDIDIAKDVATLLESKLDGCRPSGRVVISGVCGKCHQ
jgi:Fur family peroxide stress response transcriptional regulator